MKKAKWLIAAGVLLLLLALGWIFREQIIDALPIDQSGWVQRDGQTFYLNEKGDPLTGWQEIEGQRYYLGNDGILCSGWQDMNGARFYLTDAGTPITGWQELAGQTYYFGEDAAMRTGWITIDDREYYLLPSGARASGEILIDGQPHYFTAEGAPLSGWQTLHDGRLYLDVHGAPLTGWQEIEGSRYFFNENGILHSGWLEQDGTRYYLNDAGNPVTGWQEIDSKRYFFNEDGTAYSGWLEQEGNLYYLTDSGIARGKRTIDGKEYFFTSTGANIIVVNPWYYVPEDYEVELVNISGYGGRVDVSCIDALQQMLSDCRAAGYYPKIASSYRTHMDQTVLHNNMVNSYLNRGYDKATASTLASQISAIPGTSEHQLGLALDIVDANYTKLDHAQASTQTQIWLMEHCWEYGFILRYPNGTTEWTGIIYEPWHYRYVGTELSLELQDLGICLEEYLKILTEE